MKSKRPRRMPASRIRFPPDAPRPASTLPDCLAGDPARADDCWQFAADLFNLQLWCWGCDIRHPGGNLLLSLGLDRLRPPKGCGAPSIYRTGVHPAGRVCLRGFGVFFGDDRWGGLFIRRYTFAPGLTSGADLEAPPWMSDDLPPMVPPDANDAGARQLLRGLTGWIASYEEAIVTQNAADHRRQTLARWQNNTNALSAELMAPAWRRLETLLAESFPLPLPTARISARNSRGAA